jgi:putative ABC transport system substrate-binding protein
VFWALGAVALAAVQARAQSAATRIGILSPFIGPDSEFFELVRQRLRDLGYVEGRNVAFIYRSAENFEALARHATDMVRLRPSVIVTAGPSGVRAAMNATSSIPIVIANVGDAVDQGFVKSLASPGGNVTGLTSLNTELSVKRLDLLADALPAVRQVVALREAAGDSGPALAMEAAARKRGLKLEVIQVREVDELASAFEAMPATRATALCVIQSSLFASQLRRLVELAAARGIAAVYPDARYVQAGGLMSYGPDIRDMYRRSADFIDRILRGASPGSLPVEQPTVFELAINLRVARSLGITLAKEALLRATTVIE